MIKINYDSVKNGTSINKAIKNHSGKQFVGSINGVFGLYAITENAIICFNDPRFIWESDERTIDCQNVQIDRFVDVLIQTVNKEEE